MMEFNNNFDNFGQHSKPKGSMSPLSRLSLKSRSSRTSSMGSPQISQHGFHSPPSSFDSPKYKSGKFVPPPLTLFTKSNFAIVSEAMGNVSGSTSPGSSYDYRKSPVNIIHNSISGTRPEENPFINHSPTSTEYRRHSASSGSTSLSSSSSINSTSRHTSKLSKSLKGRRHSIIGKSCSICADKFRLSYGLANDRIISLTCGHDCHSECYLIMMDKYDVTKYPKCAVCNKPSKPINPLDLKNLIEATLADGASGYLEHDQFLLNANYTNQSPIVNHDTLEADNSFNTEIFSPNLEEFQASTPITASTIKTDFRSSPVNYYKTKPQEPKSLLYHEEQLLEEITKPQIKIIPEYSKLQINESAKSHELSCVLNVQMNEYLVNNFGKPIEELEIEIQNQKVVSNWIIENVLAKLDNFDKFRIRPVKVDNPLTTEDYESCPSPSSEEDEEGDLLVMFDVLMVEEEPGRWESYQFYLFTSNMLLLVDQNNNVISGLVKYKDDLASITEVNLNTIILNLSTLTLSELKVKSSNKLIIKKWKNYLNKQISTLSTLKVKRCTVPNSGVFSPPTVAPLEDEVIAKRITDSEDISTLSYHLVPLIQMTTNCWDVITDKNIVPEEVKHMYELLNNNMELPLPLLKKLIPDPEPIPIRLIVCLSLINKKRNKVSNEEYMEKIKKIVKDALDNMNPLIDKLALVYISKTIPSTNNTSSKKISSYITDITTWEAMEKQFKYLRIYDDASDTDEDINNLEETALYLEASERLLELWGDCKYKQDSNQPTTPTSATPTSNNFKFIKKLIMINDAFSKPQKNVYPTTQFFMGQSYQDKRYSKICKHTLQKLIREYKFSVHLYLLNDKLDHHMLSFLQQLINENYNTFGSSFESIRSLDDISMQDLIQNHYRKIVIPTMKIRLSSLKKNWIKLSKNEFKNNMFSLNELENTENALISPPPSSGSQGSDLVNTSFKRDRISNALGRCSTAHHSGSTLNIGRRLTSTSSGSLENRPISAGTLDSSRLLTSLSVCNTPTVPTFPFNHDPLMAYTETMADVGAEENSSYFPDTWNDDGLEVFDPSDEVEIFVNDIYPGYSKNLMISVNFTFDCTFKQIIKYSSSKAYSEECTSPGALISQDITTSTGNLEAFHKCSMLEYTGVYNDTDRIRPSDVNILIQIASSASSCTPSNSIRDTIHSKIIPLLEYQPDDRFSTMSIDTTTTNASFDLELPIYSSLLVDSRDHLYAKRQIQLTVISTLLYAIKLFQNENNQTSDTEDESSIVNKLDCKPLLLRLISVIFAIGKNCKTVSTSIKDFKIMGDMVYDEEHEMRYIEYLSFILSTVAELYESSPEDALTSSYQLICNLGFQ